MGFPWVTAMLLALPGVVLGVVGGLVGPTTLLGVVLVAAGGLYIAADVIFLQPKLAKERQAKGRRERAADHFLQRAIELTAVADVADQLARAVAAGLGPAPAYLLAPGGEGGARLYGAAGTSPPELEIDPAQALSWLGEQDGPVRRADVDSTDHGGAEFLTLLDATGCDTALPLRYRGLLLAVGLVREREAPAAQDATGFYRALRSYATVAVANTFLGARASDSGALASSVDLATAAQESLMPDERVVAGAGYALRGVYRPASQCGGDLWTWRELDRGRVLVVVGDATGHGMAPALLAAAARGAIDGVWQLRGAALDPGELLTIVNRAVHRTGRRRYLMTAFALVLDAEAGELAFANAGQNFPYVCAGENIEALVARGNPLGSGAEATFESATRTLAAGQRLLLFTDGIVETEGPRGGAFGERRFRRAVSQLAGERLQRVPERLLAAAAEHAGEVPIADDLTVVVVELSPADRPSGELTAAGTSAGESR